MVSIAARPPLAAAGSGTGSLPARVTGHTRQNQSHNAINTPAVVARAPAPSSARSTTRTSAAPGAPVMTATERVRKSIDRSHERRSIEQRNHDQAEALEPLEQVAEDPLERLSADLTALSLQHAAAMATAAVISNPAPPPPLVPAPSSVTAEPLPPVPAARSSSRQQGTNSRTASASGSANQGPSLSAATPGTSSAATGLSLADSRRFELGLGDTGLPAQLLALRDPACSVALPPPGGLPSSCLPLDNWKLDKLVLSLSANKATWRRSLLLFEWLKAAGHQLDDRLCTTLIRVCSDHGDAVSALAVYDWMTLAPAAGGAGLEATAYTYTAAMRASLAGGLTDRALAIWNEAWRRHTSGLLQADCRLCITYLELCTRLGLTDQALAMYSAMRAAPASSRMAPTVHAYTAAMRAATEGGRWYRALDIWADMRAVGCEPTGHAYSAAISACAAAGDWSRAVALFDEMTGPAGIRPDVVSCTALITALAAGGEADRAEAVVGWMLANGVRPNARTYTALMAALGNAKRWGRAVEVLGRMQSPEWGGVQPNAYTYSALLKSLGEHGQWQLAEAVFSSIERQMLGPAAGSAPPAPAALSLAAALAPSLPTPTSTVMVPSVSPLAVLLAQAAATATIEALTASAAAATNISAAEGPSSAAVGSVNAASATAGPSSAAAPTSQRTWTRPSQLHGLSLDLSSVTAAGGAADAVDEFGPSRRSFSLFSHPPAPAPAPPTAAASSSASSFSGSSSATVDDTATATSSRGSGRSSLSSGSGYDTSTSPHHRENPWRSALEQAADGALAEQLTAAACAADSGRYGASSGMLPASGLAGPAVANTNGFLTGPSAEAASLPHASHHHHHGPSHHHHHGGGGGVLNEVVCGALMLAYERAGKWQEAVGVLLRALNLGITPNTVMYNTAISAAGKAGQLEIAEKLFGKVRHPDTVTHETMIAAYGMAGLPERAEAMFSAMTAAGLRPRDFAFCGLIAAHSLAGNWEGAMRVRTRMRRAGVQPSVDVYNALLAACERAGQPDKALELLGAMRREGVEANALTGQLLALVGRQGVRSVESQQVAAAALSAAVAAYGTLLMQTGLF